MSVMDALWMKGGHLWRTVPEVIALLPRGMQHSATVTLECLLRIFARDPDELVRCKPTDLDLAFESERMAREAAEKNGVDLDGSRGYGPDFMQKGLHGLDTVLRGMGIPLIDRESGIGMHGRRVITILPVLAGREKREKPAADDPPAGPPPGPPPDPENPEKGGKGGTTTTAPPRSSSSLASLPGGDPELPPELASAAGLVPGLSAARIEGWVKLAGMELALRVVAWLRIWLAHPNPDKRPKGAYWAEKALSNWRAKLESNLITMGDVDEEIAAKVGRWGPKSAPKDDAAEKARREAEKAQERAQEAREERLRAAWGVLPADERAEILAAVLEAQPEIRRFKPDSPFVMAPCLAELERRQAAPHRRE